MIRDADNIARRRCMTLATTAFLIVAGILHSAHCEDWDVVLDVEASQERTYCGATTEMREVPKTTFRPSIKPCQATAGLWQDWYSVSVLAADPAVSFGKLSMRLSAPIELLGTDLLPDGASSPELEDLSLQPSQAMILSTAGDDGDENEDGMFTTLAQMASSDLIILVREGQEEDISMRFVDEGARAFRDNAQIGLLQVKPGLQQNLGEGPVQFVPVVDFSKPIMLRRKLFLEMGGLQCLQERCFSAGVMQLSESMWRHGLRVGLMDSGALDDHGAMSVADILERQIPLDCPRPPSQERIAKIATEIAEISGSRDTMMRSRSDRLDLYSLCFEPDRGSAEAVCGEPFYLVSIIIYTKNNPDYAARFANSMDMTLQHSGFHADDIQFLVNDDSDEGHGSWVGPLQQFANARLVLSTGLGIVRSFNKLAKMASSEFMVFLQDDSVPQSVEALDWLNQGLWFLDSNPRLQFLSGGKGELDLGVVLDRTTNKVPPTEFGCQVGEDCPLDKKIQTWEPINYIPMMYVYKASSTGGPLIVRKSDFMNQGLFRTEMYCPGEEFDDAQSLNSFAHEYSIRVWNSGADVGLYSANWTALARKAPPPKASSNSDSLDNRQRMLQRNALLYELYPATHHMKGTNMAISLTMSLKKGWHLWLSIMNSQSLRSGQVMTDEDRLKSAHALATMSHAVKMAKSFEICVSMGYALELSELGLCCVNPMTGKCWTKMTKSEECEKQSVKYSMAYCGSGYSKRRRYLVHAEWEWKHFQEILSGAKLKSEKNDLFRHLMLPQHVEDLQAQLGTEKVRHITTLNWLMRNHDKKGAKAKSQVSSSVLRLAQMAEKTQYHAGLQTPRDHMPPVVRKQSSDSRSGVSPPPKRSPQWRACMAQVLKQLQLQSMEKPALKPEDCSALTMATA